MNEKAARQKFLKKKKGKESLKGKEQKENRTTIF